MIKYVYLFVSSTEYGEKDTVYLNLFDVDSFRRIQQIILRGMLFADTERKTCPFCGEELQPVDDSFVCITCGMEITEKTCPTTQKIYYQSGLKNYKIPKETEETSIKNDKFLYDKIAESALFYRNVSPLSLSGETICPHCGKIHEE